MTYATEFPDFPAADLPPIPASWSDLSWHNDASPFFLITGTLGVWVDYADPAASDFGTDRAGRFMLVPMMDGQHTDDPETLLITDDWDALLAKAIAVSFVAGLRHALTAEDFEEMRQRNAKRHPAVCHSHDFIDANVIMDAAFKAVTGNSIGEREEAGEGGMTDEELTLWSAAWESAMPEMTAPEIAQRKEA